MTFELGEARAVLERTPRTLRALLQGLPDGWIRADEGPGTFSPLDVLGHLIEGEQHDWIPRVRVVLEHGEARAFAPFDRIAFRERCAGLDLEARLARFEALRSESLAALDEALPAADLDRRGRHPEFGPVTLRELLATWVVHDLGHVAQVTRAMAGRYREAVGPWVAYLPILTRTQGAP